MALALRLSLSVVSSFSADSGVSNFKPNVCFIYPLTLSTSLYLPLAFPLFPNPVLFPLPSLPLLMFPSLAYMLLCLFMPHFSPLPLAFDSPLSFTPLLYPSPSPLSIIPLNHPSPSSLSVIPLRHPSPSSLSVIPLLHPSPSSLSIIPLLQPSPSSLLHPSPSSLSIIPLLHPSPSSLLHPTPISLSISQVLLGHPRPPDTPSPELTTLHGRVLLCLASFRSFAYDLNTNKQCI